MKLPDAILTKTVAHFDSLIAEGRNHGNVVRAMIGQKT